MKFKIKIFIKKIRIFKRLKEAQKTILDYAYNIDQFKTSLTDLESRASALAEETFKLKGELEKIKVKKKKAEVVISQLVKRRAECMVRLAAPVPDNMISNFADYKYWIAESFIVDKFKPYIAKDSDVDPASVIRGLGKIFEKIDEKKDKKTEEKVDDIPLP